MLCRAQDGGNRQGGGGGSGVQVHHEQTVRGRGVRAPPSTPGTWATADSTLLTHFPHAISTCCSAGRRRRARAGEVIHGVRKRECELMML
jgi:hypothetical protein